jgi:hypothetical protein
MKKLLALTAAAIACSATIVSAQPFGRQDGRFDSRPDHGRHEHWRRDFHPYAERHHSICQDKARRLYAFERRATYDGRLSFWERRELAALQRDLDRTCGRYRWRG